MPARAARQELERILLSADFDASRRSRDFLVFAVDEVLAGRAEELTQVEIATKVFGRKDDFDPLLDPIVRIQAGRLRRSLERYYLLQGKADPVRLELPKGSYAPVFHRLAELPGEEAAPPPSEAPTPAGPTGRLETDWPTVVVCPFEAGGAPDEAGDRLTECLSVELGRYREARVVLQRDEEPPAASAPPGRSYELRGRLQRAGDGLVVMARLVNRATGEQVWAEEYPTSAGSVAGDRSVEDVGRLVATRIGAENGVLVQALVERRRREPEAAGGYGAILRAYGLFFARDVAEVEPAVEELQRLVARSPEASVGWMLLARLYQVNHIMELTDLPTPLDQSIAFAYQAVRLDPSSTRARSVLAASLLAKGELESARDELEEALRLNHGSLVYQEIVGWLLALLGDWERGRTLMREAMERNPYHLPHVLHGLWADHLLRGEMDAACRAALQFRDPGFFWRSLMRATSLGLLGRIEEARAEAAELRRQKPTIEERGRILIGYYLKPADLRERVVEGLAKAGLVLR